MLLIAVFKNGFSQTAPVAVLTKETLYGDSLYVSREGHIFKKGQNIRLGHSVWTQAFANVITSSTVLSQQGYRRYLSSDYAGRQVVVQSIQKLRDGKVYLQLNLDKSGKYSVDIERALFIKEVLVE